MLSLNEREIELINSTTNVKIDVRKRRGSKTNTASTASSSIESDEEALEDDPLEGPTLAAQFEHDPNVKLDVQVVSSNGVVATDPHTPSKSPKRTPASKQFVKLTDILPPLPAKGNFSVETIKKSLYFFS